MPEKKPKLSRGFIERQQDMVINVDVQKSGDGDQPPPDDKESDDNDDAVSE